MTTSPHHFTTSKGDASAGGRRSEVGIRADRWRSHEERVCNRRAGRWWLGVGARVRSGRRGGWGG
eukprot:11906935-Alexandrium_andersonii.AAC.1